MPSLLPKVEEKLGKSVFNLGYNGMSMAVAEALFLDYLERNRTPETLLLEVTKSWEF